MIAGIDPGLRGALAVLDDEGRLVALADLPVRPHGRKREIDGRTLTKVLRGLAVRCAVLEAVHSMPGQGVASCFSFGRGVGIVVGVLEALGIAYIEVAPRVWQGEVLRGLSGEGKARCLRWAVGAFPDADLEGPRGRPLDGRADALALAVYGLRRIGGGEGGPSSPRAAGAEAGVRGEHPAAV